jgi:hypothetical protein
MKRRYPLDEIHKRPLFLDHRSETGGILSLKICEQLGAQFS